MPISILGGSSGYRTISLMTRDYVATATYRGGVIRAIVQAQPKVGAWVFAHNRFMPRLLRLALFIIIVSSWPMRAFLVGLLMLPHLSLPQWATGSALVGILNICLGVAWMWHLRHRVAPWHGAEHMVIGAYRDHEQTSLEAIRAGSRVDPECGGRFLAPFIGVFLTAFLFHSLTKLSPLWVTFPMVEALLWFDHLVGVAKVPFFAKVSGWLQQHVTTSPPTDIELQAGREALLLLIETEAQHKLGGRMLIVKGNER